MESRLKVKYAKSGLGCNQYFGYVDGRQYTDGFDSYEELLEEYPEFEGAEQAGFPPKECDEVEEPKEEPIQFDREKVVTNYYRAATSLMEIGTTDNIPKELRQLCIEASSATVKIIDYINSLNKVNPRKVPNKCYEEFGQDLDGCSTQENEGCGRCSLYR